MPPREFPPWRETLAAAVPFLGCVLPPSPSGIEPLRRSAVASPLFTTGKRPSVCVATVENHCQPLHRNAQPPRGPPVPSPTPHCFPLSSATSTAAGAPPLLSYRDRRQQRSSLGRNSHQRPIQSSPPMATVYSTRGEGYGYSTLR